jgi:hypothetical protein
MAFKEREFIHHQLGWLSLWQGIQLRRQALSLDPAHGFPMQACQFANVGHWQLVAPQSCKVSQPFGHSRVAIKPGNPLGACAALATFNSAEPHLEPHCFAKHGHFAHCPPIGPVHLITAGIALRTASRGICPGYQGNPDSVCSTVEIPHPKAFPEWEVEIIILHESGGLS